jgi:hypothetical protein
MWGKWGDYPVIAYQYTIDCRGSVFDIENVSYDMNKQNDGTGDFMALCGYVDSIVAVDIASVSFDFATSKLSVILPERVADDTFTHIGDTTLTETEVLDNA